MRSWIVWLCQSAGEVSAEAKLLLGGVIRQYGDGSVRGMEKSIGKRLGMSARVASRVMTELVAAKHLIPEPAPSTGKPGRPAVMYKVRPALLSHAPVEKPVAWDDKDKGGQFEDLIERLLAELSEGAGGKSGPSKAPSREGAAERLSPSNRLLLAVLLGLADRNGVVNGWGPSELSRLVGLTPGRFAGQIGKLLNLGYLRAIVSGVSGRQLFGKKPGAFFLNLSHPSYKGLVPEVVLLFPVEELELNLRSQGDAWVIYRQIEQMRWREPSGYVRALFRNAGYADTGRVMKGLAFYFDGVGTSTLPEYFQMRLEAYSTHLLSSGQPQGDYLMASQMQEVMARDAFKRSFEELKGGQRTYLHLVEYLARRQVDLMQRAVERMSRLVGPSPSGAAINLEGASYTLVPAISTSGGRYVAICAMPASGRGGKPSCFIAGEGAENGAIREGISLSNEEMWEYGLLTRQFKKVPKWDLSVVRAHLKDVGLRILSGDIS